MNHVNTSALRAPNINRRNFAAGALALAAAPLASRAQTPGRTYRIVVISTGRRVEEISETGHPEYQIFFRELRRLGYVEGANLAVSRWSAVGLPEAQYAEFGRAIVALAPDLIVSAGSRLIVQLKAATKTVPIVMLVATDPSAWGIVERLNRPGGNITGFAGDAGVGEAGKRLQLLTECAPAIRSVGYLGTPGGWSGPLAAALRDAADRMGLPVQPLNIDGPVNGASIRRALAGLAEPGTAGIIAASLGELVGNRHEFANAALELRLPVVSYFREEAQAGILLSYGAQFDDSYRGAAGYVDRILKGTNPAELPVQQPTRFDLTLNLKTAKALGLEIPLTILVQATEVIE
jgi:putative tryptophan/tyrosine transport system substrate-binding protein